MTYVWVVECGEYSDYRVVGVFSSEANAQLVADAIRAGEYGEGPDVAKWELDPAVDALNQGHRLWYVVMLRDGAVERVDRQTLSAYEIGHTAAHIWKRTKAPAYKGKGIPDALTMTVWAKDETHAVKIVNEKRAQMIANGQWP